MSKKNKKLGQEQAFSRGGYSYGINNHAIIKGTPGMSKRFYAACSAMQGICVNIGRNGHSFSKISEIIKTSYELADELLKQENDE